MLKIERMNLTPVSDASHSLQKAPGMTTKTNFESGPFMPIDIYLSHQIPENFELHTHLYDTIIATFLFPFLAFEPLAD